MTSAPTLTHSWASDCEILQCLDCGGRLEPADEALACMACRRSYPIREGMLDTMPQLTGNNQIAAEYYDSPLWPKFRFWEWFTFMLSGGTRRARSQVTQHLENLPGSRLLEVAIGDGDNVPLIPEDCQIYGNDISEVQLAGCRRRHGNRHLRLIKGEAEKLPFRDNTFDNVLSLGAFNYFNDPLQSLREMARVVKPGHRIVVCDEYPYLPNLLWGHRIGLPKLDRWILSSLMHLGPKFTEMVDKHRDLKLEPLADAVLEDWKIHTIWSKLAYVIVGRPKK